MKGKLEAATGSFSGNLNAGVGGVIGGWKIGGNYIQSTDGSLTLYSDGRVKFDGSVLRSNGSGMSIKYGLELYTSTKVRNSGMGRPAFESMAFLR